MIVIGSPLHADEDSQRRLLRKVENYLGYTSTHEFRDEFGEPSPTRTRIVVRVHSESDPLVHELIERCKPWALSNNVSLVAEKLSRCHVRYAAA